jgi:hydrogenase-4 transcriptional activator
MTSPYLLELWREACRHIELSESLPNFAALLAPSCGEMTLEVRVLDRAQATLERVGASEDVPASSQRIALEARAVPDLMHWCALREVWPHAGFTQRHPTVGQLLGGVGRCWIAGLYGMHEVTGLLVMSSTGEQAVNEATLKSLIDPVTAALENHLRLHELERLRAAAEAEREHLRDRLGRADEEEPLIGADGGLAEVVMRVHQVARADVPVLLLGETGSGKEVVAREIHTHSSRGTGPFIRVNCGAIPAELIDSELFGHERGSFTGATARRQGWFERADGGTLFMDEIGELPPAAQVRLLRVLQDGLVHRVGAERAVPVVVRVVAATHCDLPQMVQSGTFRADLWYRIATFPIVIPPLRERTKDIQALAEHFARRAARRFGLRTCMLMAADLDRLVTYDWPGNVRELAAVIDRAAILGNGQRLAIEQALGFHAPASTQRAETPLEAGASSPSRDSGAVTLDAAMRRHIEQVLVASHGRIEGRRGAAQLLAINPHTLRAKMRKLGIDWQSFRDL